MSMNTDIDVTAMIIDDSEINRYILSRQLKMAGVTNIFENDGGHSALTFLSKVEENIEKYKGKFPPTVIFLDINMPNINGFDFLERFVVLSEDDIFRECKVVIYSSSALQEDKDRAFTYKCVSDYLVKGDSTIDDVKALVRKLH